MSIPTPDHDDVVADLRFDVPLEVDEADAVEQRTPSAEPAPGAGGDRDREADDGDLAESAVEIELDEEEDDRS